jgi:hypothetical protein
MAVTIGNETNTEFFQGATTKTVALDTGSSTGRVLLAYCYVPSARTITSVTYNGVAMTQLQTTFTDGTTSFYIFGLNNPASGSNNIVVTYDSAPNTTCSLHAQAFGGATLGTVNDNNVGFSNDPGSSLTVSRVAASSIIWNQTWCSFYGTSFVRVDGVDSTKTSESTGGTYHSAGWYSAALTDGSKTITSQQSNNASLHSIEIKQSGVLTIGNKTNRTTNPGASTTDTFSHTQDTGSNGYLLVLTAISTGAANESSVTYGGQSMTLLDTQTTTTTTMRMKAWGLANPPTGANNVVVTWASGPFNPYNAEAISFTNSNGFGNVGFADTQGPPNTATTVTVSANSVIVGTAAAGTAGSNVTIDSSSRPIDYNNNCNNFVFGGVSAPGLTAGSKTSSFNATAQVAAILYEIKEYVAATAGSKNTQFIWL